YRAGISNVIAVERIEGIFLVQINFLPYRIWNPPFTLLYDITSLINERGNAAICRTGYPPAVLNCPQLGVIEMLIFSGSVSPPGIVGNNGDKLCTLSDIVAHITAPYRFIANNRCCANAALRIKDGSLVLTPIAAGSSSKGREKRLEKRQRGREGHPFHTRHEFRFMIKLHPLRIF